MRGIAAFIAELFTALFGRWWVKRKDQEAQNAQNDVAAMVDTAVSQQLRDHWTKR
jgi:TorA maturation chaperone TorD